eukprot:UN27647
MHGGTKDSCMKPEDRDCLSKMSNFSQAHCMEITCGHSSSNTEEICLSGRENRSIITEGRDIRGRPCIWCENGGCLGGSLKCESLDYLQTKIDVMPEYITGNCEEKSLSIPRMETNKCLTDYIKSKDDFHVAFIGDSTMQEFARLFAYVYGCDNVKNETDIETCEDNSNYKKIYDRIHSCETNHNFRYSFEWNGAPDVCGNHFGLKSFDSDRYVDYLFERLKDVDILIFNSGLHDITRDNFTFDEYENDLRKVVELIDKNMSEDTIKIWRETVARTSFEQCDDNNGLILGNPGVKQMNGIANEIFTEKGWNT